MPIIRPSRDEDLPAITAIYAHHVLHGTGTFETTPPSEAEMAARRADVLGRKGLPWLVAEEDGQVLGFAYCQLVQAPPGLPLLGGRLDLPRPTARGRGLGRKLLAELAAQRRSAGVRKLIAVIGDSANAGSVGCTARWGSRDVGVLRSVRLEIWPLAGRGADGKDPGAGRQHLTGIMRPHEKQDRGRLAGLPGRPAGPAPLLSARPGRPAGLAAADPHRAGSVRHRAGAAVWAGRPVELAADSAAGLHHCRLRADRHRLRPDDARAWNARYNPQAAPDAPPGRTRLAHGGAASWCRC
jgi:L-amino acid N-acyltransferase YncA